MAKVDYEQLDDGIAEMYVDNKPIARWYSGRTGEMINVDGISQVIRYLVDRLETAEANSAALNLVLKREMDRLDELEERLFAVENEVANV
jgi:hypothetical protein